MKKLLISEKSFPFSQLLSPLLHKRKREKNPTNENLENKLLEQSIKKYAKADVSSQMKELQSLLEDLLNFLKNKLPEVLSKLPDTHVLQKPKSIPRKQKCAAEELENRKDEPIIIKDF